MFYGFCLDAHYIECNTFCAYSLYYGQYIVVKFHITIAEITFEKKIVDVYFALSASCLYLL